MMSYPNDWTETTLGESVQIARGASPRPIEAFLTSSADGTNWIKIGDAPKEEKYIYHTAERITKSGANKSVPVCAGDFILSNSMSFGRPYILAVDGCIHDGWLRLYDYQGQIDKDFLYYILSSRFTQEQYVAFAAGSGVQNLNKDVVKKVVIYLPSLPEQRAIAQTLDSFDTYITNLTQLIEKKKAIREGALFDLITGKTRLDGFSDKWKPSKIGNILSILHGRNQKSVETPYGKYPILGTGGIIGYANQPLCTWECVLIGRKGTIDQPFYMNTPFWTIDTLYYSKPMPEQCVKYQYYLFCTIDWYNYAESSGRPSLTRKAISEIEISLPSYEEQCAIADALTLMDNEIHSLEIELDKIKQIREGAMDDLLTGKVRLKD